MIILKSKKNYTKYFLLFVCVFLLFFIFKWVDFLIKNHYLQSGTYVELFNGNMNLNSTSRSKTEDPTTIKHITGHAINMPYFADYTCNNWCGPQSQCLLTRQQCTSDVDCGGCHDLASKNNYNYTKPVGMCHLGQSFNCMNKKILLPKSASENILENEYIHFSVYNKGN